MDEQPAVLDTPAAVPKAQVPSGETNQRHRLDLDTARTNRVKKYAIPAFIHTLPPGKQNVRGDVSQIAAFRDNNATAIQRMVRGMQARVRFHRKRAEAVLKRQMLFLTARAHMASARIARRIREEMRRKNVRARLPRCDTPPPPASGHVFRTKRVKLCTFLRLMSMEPVRTF